MWVGVFCVREDIVLQWGRNLFISSSQVVAFVQPER